MIKPTVLEALIAKFGYPLIDQKDTIRKYKSKDLAKEFGFSASRIRSVLRAHGVSLHKKRHELNLKVIKPKKRKPQLKHPPLNDKEISFNKLLQKTWR